MAVDYPVQAILAAVAGACVFSTVPGALILRAGFLLSTKRRIERLCSLSGCFAISILSHHFVMWLQISRLSGYWPAPAVDLFNHPGAGAVALFLMTTRCVFYPRVLAGFEETSWPTIYAGRVFRSTLLVAASVVITSGVIVLRTSDPLSVDNAPALITLSTQQLLVLSPFLAAATVCVTAVAYIIIEHPSTRSRKAFTPHWLGVRWPESSAQLGAAQ